MRIIAQPSELSAGARPVALALGVFDGVHVGHREVISRMVVAAREQEAVGVVVTFDRHPNAVVAPAHAPPAIQTTAQRLRAFADLGADVTWLIRFDGAFSRQTGEQFVRAMVPGFGRVATLCVGSGFRFGYRRQGDVALLERLGRELGYATIAVEPVSLDGETVSSTRVRELIRAGLLAEAGRLLGRPYALAGPIVAGDGLGRKLGFPTANLDVSGLVLPPNGVYAARAVLAGHRFVAVMNIGVRPTVRATPGAVRVEAHLLDLDRNGDLYGQELIVTPITRLRDEQRFPSLDELQTQIGRDATAARRALS